MLGPTLGAELEGGGSRKQAPRALLPGVAVGCGPRSVQVLAWGVGVRGVGRRTCAAAPFGRQAAARPGYYAPTAEVVA